MRPLIRAAMMALALTAFCLPALAQDNKGKAPAAPQASPALPEAPQKKAEETPGRKTPVTVEHDDNDPVGARLAYRLKEQIGRSSLMVLTNKDEKKVVIVLKTKEEFPGRPNLSSIYAVSWLFSSREGSLKYFLTSEAGIVDNAGIDQAAEEILGKTDKLATTYGYLF